MPTSCDYYICLYIGFCVVNSVLALLCGRLSLSLIVLITNGFCTLLKNVLTSFVFNH